MRVSISPYSSYPTIFLYRNGFSMYLLDAKQHSNWTALKNKTLWEHYISLIHEAQSANTGYNLAPDLEDR